MIAGFVVWALGSLARMGLSGIVDSTMDFIRRTADTDVRYRELEVQESLGSKKIEAEVLVAQLQARVQQYNVATTASIARSPAQLASPLFWAIVVVFLAPLAFYWGALNLYNVLWCSRCAFPQTWQIAAFPEQSVVWANTMVQWIFGPLAIGGAVGLAVKMARS